MPPLSTDTAPSLFSAPFLPGWSAHPLLLPFSIISVNSIILYFSLLPLSQGGQLTFSAPFLSGWSAHPHRLSGGGALP
jgi:hypothetical protein